MSYALFPFISLISVENKLRWPWPFKDSTKLIIVAENSSDEVSSVSSDKSRFFCGEGLLKCGVVVQKCANAQIAESANVQIFKKC